MHLAKLAHREGTCPLGHWSSCLIERSFLSIINNANNHHCLITIARGVTKSQKNNHVHSLGKAKQNYHMLCSPDTSAFSALEALDNNCAL